MRYVTSLLLFLFLLAFLPQAAPEGNKTAVFDITLVKAYKADKDKMPDCLEDISESLKNATTYNAFALIHTLSLTVSVGGKNDIELGVQGLKLEMKISSYDKKTKNIKGTISVIRAKGKKFSILCRAKIDMEKGGVLCIVPGEYDGGELIVAVKLTSVK